MAKKLLLVLIGLVMAAAIGFAAGQAEEEQETAPSGGATQTGGEFGEAPVLAEMVAAGELPPVEDRLPEEPMVAAFEGDTVGVYGGDLQYSTTSLFGINKWTRESLLMFEKGGQTPIPALARDYDVSDDGRQYTFYLREGHKWSDGEPFTARDIMFWWEDIMNNENIRPTVPSWLESGGPTEVTMVDDHTIRFEFAEPYALFPKVMCFNGAWEFEGTAFHYLKQFHADYQDEDTLNEMVDEAGFDDWVQLFGNRRNVLRNTEAPTLNAWKLTQAWPADRLIMERNPYYYKVDAAGNQLPYIDRVVATNVANSEVAVLQALDGQVDFQMRHMNFAEMPLLQESAEAGGYHVARWPAGPGWIAIAVNQNAQDDAKREIFQTTEFRHALSFAINRDKINELAMFGVGKKIHPVASEMDEYFVDGFGDTAIEYDPEMANQLLDEAGLDQRDSAGFRLLPNGERLQITIDTYDMAAGSKAVEFATLVAEDWEAVGVQTTAREIARELWAERTQAGEFDMAIRDFAGINWDLTPDNYIPWTRYTTWAPQWGLWYESRGADGVEPPEQFKQMQGWFEELAATVDHDERLRLGRQILEVHDEEVFIIGVLKRPFQPVIINNNLRNALEDGINSYRLLDGGQAWHETFYYVNGTRK
jgi:peptide/nickel transport system substrate-binding protein